jgi:hypothetical protein
MSASRKSEKSAAAEAPGSREAAAGGEADAAPETDPLDEPLNRAERRAKAKAKGKSSALPPASSKVRTAGQTGPAHTVRQWANRRSG